ncbi:DUF602-domain-containing protein [Neoconidiobolus thromboides FSU 785]|nr:DUF602-domain-containing protein [Neoconidiobolus thromboides FSU 785]
MGNDGGSIPKRTELVKTKKKAVKSDNSEKLISKWHFCALSKAILSMPVVVCALGKLYNKEAILEHLINGSASKYGDSDKICPHVTSMSHIKELNLTENPTFDKTKSSSSPFICPLNQKVMNGNLPFVYISKCGCVFSKAGIKDLRGTEMKCPLCSKAYEEADITDINPPEETQTELFKRKTIKYDSKSPAQVVKI